MFSKTHLFLLTLLATLAIVSAQDRRRPEEADDDVNNDVDEPNVDWDDESTFPDPVIPDPDDPKSGRTLDPPTPEEQGSESPVVVPSEEAEVDDDEAEAGSGKRGRSSDGTSTTADFEVDHTEDVDTSQQSCNAVNKTCMSPRWFGRGGGKACYKLKTFRGRYCFWAYAHVSTGSTGCHSGCVGVKLQRCRFCAYIYVRRAVGKPCKNPPADDRCKMDVALVVDRSGSIQSSHFSKQRTFFKHLITQMQHPSRQLNVRFSITFHKPVTYYQSWTGNRNALFSRLNNLKPAGMTDIGGAVRRSCQSFQSNNGRCRAMIAASDGFSNYFTVRSAASYCRSAPVKVDTHGVVGPYTAFGGGVMRAIGVAPGRFHSDFTRNQFGIANRIANQMIGFCWNGCRYPTSRSLEANARSYIPPPTAWEIKKYVEPGTKLGVYGRELEQGEGEGDSDDDTATDAPPEDESTAGRRDRPEDDTETATAGRREG